MSSEAGDEVEGEGDLAPPDWRVRAVEVTHMPLRDWRTHCVMGRGRTHHHVTNQKSEDQSRMLTIAMDYYFVKMESVVNAQCQKNQ